MGRIFGVDIAGIVKKTFKGNLNTGVLKKISYDDRDDADLTAAPAEITQLYDFDGIVDTYEDKLINGTSILMGDRQILIIAGTLPTGIRPSTSDQITMDGETYTIVDVKLDPAGATYQCHARR